MIANVWNTILTISSFEGDTEVSEGTLLCQNSKVFEKVVFVYTLETFLYKEMNRASRERDQRLIPTLGPYAALLSAVIRHHQGSDF